MSEGESEMPRYRSHKEVHALQIDKVDGHRLTFRDKRYAPMDCDPVMFNRYQPKSGDYLVVYRDGYRSFSPQSEFEDGYTRL